MPSQWHLKGLMIGMCWLTYAQSTIFEGINDEAALGDLWSANNIWMDRWLGCADRLLLSQTIFERINNKVSLADLYSANNFLRDWWLGCAGWLMPRQWYLKGSMMKRRWPTYTPPMILEGIDDWAVLDDLHLVNDIWRDQWLGCYVRLIPNQWYLKGSMTKRR